MHTEKASVITSLLNEVKREKEEPPGRESIVKSELRLIRDDRPEITL